MTRRNIELKARLHDIERAREIATSLATQPVELQVQVDTYFNCQQGRLKLRQIAGLRAELISYVRADLTGSKTSYYELLPIREPLVLRSMLEATLGICIEVQKRREIYLHHNVRIHLDRVEGLGEFLEFEAVLAEGQTEQVGRRQVAQLQEEFGIAEGDLIAGSYSDLLAAR